MHHTLGALVAKARLLPGEPLGCLGLLLFPLLSCPIMPLTAPATQATYYLVQAAKFYMPFLGSLLLGQLLLQRLSCLAGCLLFLGEPGPPPMSRNAMTTHLLDTCQVNAYASHLLGMSSSFSLKMSCYTSICQLLCRRHF